MAHHNGFTKQALAASFSVLILTACGGEDPKGKPGGGAGGPPPAEVDVIAATSTGSTMTQDLPGRLQAVRTAQVRARVEGILEKRLFVEGSEIKAGESLFQIDKRTYQASLDAAKAEMEQARVTVERYRPLVEIKAVSKQEIEQAEVRLKQAESAVQRTRLDLENTTVPAPIFGRIGRALVTEGALVGKGEATHLATIEQIDPIFVNFTQSNSELLRLQQAIKAGKMKRANQARVELVQEDGSVYALPGRLLFTDLAVDPETGSVAMRAEFPNPQRELLPGQFVRIRINQAQLDKAIRLPQRAVLSSEQGQYVLTVNADNKVEPRPITTIGMSGPDWLVSGGLKGDEKIIVNGVQKARPGSVVKPVPWSPQAEATPAAGPASQTQQPTQPKPAAESKPESKQ